MDDRRTAFARPPDLTIPYSHSSDIDGLVSLSSVGDAKIFDGGSYDTLNADVSTMSRNENFGNVDATFSAGEATTFITFTVPANTAFRITSTYRVNGVFYGHLAANSGNQMSLTFGIGGSELYSTFFTTLGFSDNVTDSGKITTTGVLQGGTYSIEVSVFASSGVDDVFGPGSATTNLTASVALLVGNLPSPSRVRCHSQRSELRL